jgi:alkylation response protein AidB-like acyl-CoA dehydrogenase
MTDPASLVAERVDKLLAELDPATADDVEFRGRQFDLGLAWVHFPEGSGGLGLPPVLQKDVDRRVHAAGAAYPGTRHFFGLAMAGPTIVTNGDEAIRQRLLRRTFTGEDAWCQLFSEPGAGSDLAGLATKAVRDGDEWLISGQKVWNTLAHIADRGLLVARTDPEAPKHKGLTYFALDMHAPGVEVRPLRQITGEAEFNEIFFTDVQVPAENLLGEVGGGWQVAMTTLLHERGTLGFALQAALEVQIRKLVSLARDRGADPLQRDLIAREWIEMQAVRYTNYRSLSTLMKTGLPGPEGSISKLVWSESNQRVTKLALELLGPDAALGEDNAPYGGYWQYQQLRSRGNTIEAGTSEVLRNIVAERVLGLPYSR